MKTKLGGIHGLAAKTALAIMATLLLSMLMGALVVPNIVERELTANYEAAKDVTVQNIPGLLAPWLQSDNPELIENTLTTNLRHKYIASLAVYDRRGTLIRAVEESGAAGAGLSYEKYGISSNGEVLGNVEIGFYTGYIREQAQGTTLTLLLGMAGVFAIAALILVGLVRRFVTTPLQVLTKSVEQVGAGRLTARAKVRGKDEIGRLGNGFNQMAEALQRHEQDLRNEMAETKRAKERISQLSSMLGALRNVNQLITREKDSQSLIQKSCDLLVQGESYGKSFIVLFDERRNVIATASAGWGEDGPSFMKQLEAGDYPAYLRELLAQDRPFIVLDRPAEQHQGRAPALESSGEGAFRGKLEYEGKLYGVVGIDVTNEMVAEGETQHLLLELTGDIAFALANIEQEEERKAAVDALCDSEARNRDLYQNAPVVYYSIGTDGLVKECLARTGLSFMHRRVWQKQR
jgi:HAMP domain-containing protein